MTKDKFVSNYTRTFPVTIDIDLVPLLNELVEIYGPQTTFDMAKFGIQALILKTRWMRACDMCSVRQKQVLWLLLEDLNYVEIAKIMNISKWTAREFGQRAQRNLGTRSREELIFKYGFLNSVIDKNERLKNGALDSELSNE